VENQISKQVPSSQRRYWQAHIKALSESGLSRAEYCRRHTLSYHAVIYWQRKFTKNEKRGVTLVPVALPNVLATTGSQNGDAGLKILLPGQIAIAVADNFSPSTLVRVLKALEAR
jgi:hypothetical protein